MRELSKYINESVFDLDNEEGMIIGDRVGDDLTVKKVDSKTVYLECDHDNCLLSQDKIEELYALSLRTKTENFQLDSDVVPVINGKELNLKGLGFETGLDSWVENGLGSWRLDDIQTGTFTIKNGYIAAGKMILDTYHNNPAFSSLGMDLGELNVIGKYMPEIKNNCKVYTGELVMFLKKESWDDLYNLSQMRFPELLKTLKIKNVKFNILRVHQGNSEFSCSSNGKNKKVRGLNK